MTHGRPSIPSPPWHSHRKYARDLVHPPSDPYPFRGRLRTFQTPGPTFDFPFLSKYPRVFLRRHPPQIRANEAVPATFRTKGTSLLLAEEAR